MKANYLVYINDENGKSVVVVPAEKNLLDSERALKIANRFFRTKSGALRVVAGVRKGNKVSSVDCLSQTPDCWMVWRK